MAGNDSYTKLLLHFNEPDGQFRDSSIGGDHGICIGNPACDTFVYKFGGGAFSAQWTTITTVQFPYHTDWVLGTDIFTIDFWCRTDLDESTGWSPAFQQSILHAEDAMGYYFVFAGMEGNQWRFWMQNGTGPNLTCVDDTIKDKDWHHIAVVRNGNTAEDWYFFVDGVSKSITIDTPACDIQPGELPLMISTTWTSWPMPWMGNIDEFRWSKGIARWTENFPVPTEEYSAGPAGIPKRPLPCALPPTP